MMGCGGDSSWGMVDVRSDLGIWDMNDSINTFSQTLRLYKYCGLKLKGLKDSVWVDSLRSG